jgi:hypothetical protein
MCIFTQVASRLKAAEELGLIKFVGLYATKHLQWAYSKLHQLMVDLRRLCHTQEFYAICLKVTKLKRGRGKK